MDNIIDFKRKRAILRSGIKDQRVIDEMLEKRLDPCNPEHRKEYNEDKAIDFFFKQFKQDTIDQVNYDIVYGDITIDTGDLDIKYVTFKDDDD
jgi:hypothetical protein